MNGYANHDLDEDAFGEKRGGGSALRTFDAFPKTKPNYTTASRRGGQWTVIILAICTFLSVGELVKWYRGTENQHFSVEKGISRELQMNIDMVVKMPCNDVRVNVQDASGDHIMAGMLLYKDNTNWDLWNEKLNQVSSGVHEYQTLNAENTQRLLDQEEDVHARHVLQHTRKNPRRKFPKSPKLSSKQPVDSCRIYGSLEGNKVHGDFHITARGHGYSDVGQHLDHSAFNFTHMITELSFGPHYPSLLNPLDKTIASTEKHYYKYQYFLNIVPTIYSKGNGAVEKYTKNPAIAYTKTRNTINTNQYSATSHSYDLPENPFYTPGIFFKYNIEPILLFVTEERGSFLALLVRLVNVVSGVMVTGGWLFQLSGWASEVLRRRRRGFSQGVLNGRTHSTEDEE